MAWRTVLDSVGLNPALFDEAFLLKWDSAAWQPDKEDAAAAAKLHIQLVSRITTQPLGYRDGDEKTALKSVYTLFEKTREIASAHPTATHFEEIAWHVLNQHVRWFTAKWHARSERGVLSALDATDEFRADLDGLRPTLQQFDRVLLFLRDGKVPDVAGSAPVAARARPDDGTPLTIEEEWKEGVSGGINQVLSGLFDASQAAVDAINLSDKQAIEARRKHYGLLSSEFRSGLALSGGGIRSATFSLGVLIALARRNLLPKFDYMSTVSGGGYLGAFISAFVQSPGTDVGLCANQLPFKRDGGEAAALRHIRHHSRYLAVGNAWEKLQMLAAQVLGMALNVLAVVWLLVLVAPLEYQVRTRHPVEWHHWLLGSGVALTVGALVSLLLLRLGKRRADWVFAASAFPLAAGLLWHLLGMLHTWFASPPAWPLLANRKLWVAVAGALPALAPVLQALFPRVVKRARGVVVALVALSAPAFVVGVYLLAYAHWSQLLRLPPPHSLQLAYGALFLAGLVIYIFLFDINRTSPHRHYRRKLAEAFVIRPGSAAGGFDEAVEQKISTLGHKGPYHLINCALNVPSSDNIAMQGRLTDFFVFSPAYCGSPLLRYENTSDWEKRNPELDLATAMAISGAAASPQMGTGTVARLRFWLALFNVRLGYWLLRRDGAGRFVPPGLIYLLREMTGYMSENTARVNLSDGGHIENLGIYELLRRRCRFIVAIDGEEDAAMTFQGLTTVQRMAAIDLGVEIEVDLEDLRLTAAGLSRSHFRFCRVRYPKTDRGSVDEFGYLLYVKLSLTGNEGEFIRRYRLDDPAFPHDSTADQFFSEAQFEAYRSLGEHVGNKLFLRAIVGGLADATDVTLDEWFYKLADQLLEQTARRRR